MRLKVDTSGLDDVRQRMRGLGEKDRRRIMANALRAGARVYKNRLVGARINTRTGRLRRGYVQAYIKARGGIRKDGVIAWVAARRKGTGAYHSHLYEWGSKKRFATYRRKFRGYRGAWVSLPPSKVARGRMPSFRPMSKALAAAWPSMRRKIEDSVDRGIKKAFEGLK